MGSDVQHLPGFLGDVHFILDTSGKIIFIDSACMSIFNMHPEKCMECIDFNSFIWVHPDDRDRVVDNYNSVISGEVPERIKYRLAAGPGDASISHLLEPIYDNSDNLVSMHGVFEIPHHENKFSLDEDRVFGLLEAFNEISSIITRNDDFKRKMDEILEKAIELTEMEKGGIYLLDRNTGDYVLEFHSSVSEEFKKKHGRITQDWSSLHAVMNHGKVVSVPDTCTADITPERKRSTIKEGFRSYVSIPLIDDKSILGILMASSSMVQEYSDIQVKFFSIIGQQIGMAIQNANLMEELSKSREMYSDLFENAADVMYIHDMEGNFLSINQACANILGINKEDTKRYHIRDFLTEDCMEIANEILDSVIKGEKKPIPPVLEVNTMNGNRLFLEFNVRPVIENGKLIGIHGIARDVDKRLRAEENHLVFTKSINLARDGIVISDGEHNITFITEVGAGIFGYSKAELIGQLADIFYAEEDISNLTDNVIPAVEKYGYFNGLIMARKKDGTAFPLEVTLSSMRDDNGKTLVIIGVFREKKSNKKSQKHNYKLRL